MYVIEEENILTEEKRIIGVTDIIEYIEVSVLWEHDGDKYALIKELFDRGWLITHHFHYVLKLADYSNVRSAKRHFT